MADKVPEIVEKLAKEHQWDRGNVSPAESIEKPNDAAKSVMSDLAKLCFAAGVDLDGARRSQFFASFNEQAQLTPYFRWCSQQDPVEKYMFSKDAWYKTFASKVDAKKRCKAQEPAAPAPAAAAVQYAQPYFPSVAPNVPQAWEPLAALRAENTTLTERLSELEDRFGKVSAFQAAQLQRIEKRLVLLEADKPEKRRKISNTKTVSTKKTPKALQGTVSPSRLQSVTVGYCLLQSVYSRLQYVYSRLQSVTVSCSYTLTLFSAVSAF
jgi:hypothetical protein